MKYQKNLQKQAEHLILYNFLVQCSKKCVRIQNFPTLEIFPERELELERERT